MTRLLVTGASGFIGANFVPAAAARGFEVRPVFRRAEQCEPWRDAFHAGELTQFNDWRAALSGIDAVVHLAARAHRPLRRQQAERAIYKRINTDLPSRIAEEAAAAGVPYFVFLSSVGVHGRATDGRLPFTENDPFAPMSLYAETKAEAEQRLAEIAQRTGLALTVIRPVLVYGAGARGNFKTLVQLIRAGIPLPLASVRNRRAFVAVDNVSSLILHRLEAQPYGTETFIVADEERVSTPEFIRSLGDALHHNPTLFPFPPALLKRILFALDRKDMAESLLASLDVDTQAAKQAGWRPVVSLRAGLARAVADLIVARN